LPQGKGLTLLCALQNFVADEPQALRVIRTFLDGQQSGRKPAADISSMHEPGMRLLSRNDESLARQYQVGPSNTDAAAGRGQASTSSPAKSWRGAVGAGGSDIDQQAGGKQQQQQGGSASPARDGRQVQDQARGGASAVSTSGPAQGGGKVLGMFKQGGRLKPSGGAGRQGRRDDQGLATAAALERKVGPLGR
jgi:hypothetical protein